MTAYPRGQAGSTTAAEVNRAAKISSADLANPNPDVLTLLKLQVEIMDQLEVTDNAAWVIRLAQLPATVQKLFEAGTYNRIRYRHRVYGYDTRTLYSMLFAMMTNNKITRWYNLAASTPVAAEWQTVTEVLGGQPLTQTSALRKPAASTAPNGVPVAVYDGTDVLLQPLEAGNNSTTSWWILLRVRAADFGASQALHDVVPPAASARRSKLMLTGGTGAVLLDLFVSGFNGRRYETAGAVTVATSTAVYIEWVASRTNECDTTGLDTDARLRIFINNTAQAITPSDNGLGGVPVALLAATDSACIGGSGDSDAPSTPLRNGGQIGPHMFNGETPLTAAELANLVAFMVPN